jgi:ATP-dependent helicase/nuclease subunit B
MAAVQFILGRSGTGKSRWCIDAVCDALADAGAESLILLVPEQATYQVERSILSTPGIAGFSRLHVLSFNRLGFWLQSHRSHAADISRTGKQMILHKLLLEQVNELTLYKSSVTTMGLAEKLSGLLDELQHSGCTAKQVTLLAEALTHKPAQSLAARKWSDIAKIFAAYEAYFTKGDGGFSNPDTELNTAKDSAAETDFLKGARLWVDGFSGFSVQERDLLAELLKVSQDASIALCLDPATMDLANADEEALDPCSLFASTEQTYCELLRIVRGCKLPLTEPVILNKPLRFSDTPALATLEANFASDKPGEPAPADGAIQIVACGNIRAEMLWAAAQIRTLVKNNGCRYRNIAVVVPDMDAYQHYIESAFTQYDLPYFLDRPRQMKTHPVTELIGAALQSAGGGFGLSDVLSYLKSPLMTAPIEQIDALENYCRAFDVQASEWLQKTGWDFADADEKSGWDEAALDALRREVVSPLRTLRKALTIDKTISVGQFVSAVWDLLGTLGLQEILAEWAAEDVTDQQFGHRQVFAKLVELMDELCEIFGGVELSAQAWESIFTDALSSMTIKLIPPTLDQVLVGSIERSRHPDIKAIFLIGAAQKQFPVPVMGESLLTEQDYQCAANLELANPYEKHLMHRPYLAYIALTRASKQVFLSYPLADEKGAAIVPWSGIEHLTTSFTDLDVQFPAASATPKTIETDRHLAQWLCGRLGKDRPMDDSAERIAAGVLEQMSDSSDEELKQTASHVQKSLDYDNTAGLDSELAEQIFKFPMTTSASRLGTFARCPYQYFAKYTLGLERRQTLRFEPMDVGTFYHDVLEAIFKALKAKGKDWADLSGDELMALCDTESERVISENSQLVNFMRQRIHHRYIIQSACEVLRSFVPMLAQLSKAGHFKQIEAELKFGPSDGVKIVIPLDDKRIVQLAGRIDRLDMADIDGQPTAVVFDYKSGGKSVDFAGVLYGLDLQLPIYLLAARGENTIPAGAFFLPIASPTTSAVLSDIDTVEAAFNKAKGLFDGRFFEALDTKAAASGGRSEYYNFYVNKDGEPYSYYKTSGALKPDDFTALLDYTEGRIKKLIEDLSAGCISVTPFRIGTNSPCGWCDYRPLCRFDWQINDYNILDNVGKEEALERMKSE